MFILAMKVSSNSFGRKKCPYRLAIDKKGGTVEHWSSWDWLTYISIWIAAIFIAIREAVRTTLSPTNIFRRAIRARYLAYLPIVLMTVGGLILIARATGYIRPESTIGIVTRPLSAPSEYLGPHPWLDAAFGEFGERRYFPKASNPRIIMYLKTIPGTENKTEMDDWSSAFVEWSLNQTGISGPKTMAPRSWLYWGESISEGREGCIVILSFRGGDEHIGFLLAQDSNSVVVFGGNTVDEVGIRRYQKSDVLAYRWPAIPAETKK
jgi:uncharacterized protein (TIGR02594 family)